jgi:hydroxymethylglutaryl-CoA lyase
MIQLIECPRDAMQGLHRFIPTEVKINYINQLLQVGFDTLDFGSFVNPKAIPQMADTSEVLQTLDLSSTSTKLLAIVANSRGAETACAYPQIKYLGYPFSLSETFQMRNTNATIAESVERVAQIQRLCLEHDKELVLYLSMGFGNPYGDPWNLSVVGQWIDELIKYDIRTFSLSDTIGCSNPQNIEYLFKTLIPKYPEVSIGAHLHTQPHNWREKVEAAYAAGCRRFDGALKGYGGCPMAKDELTGNMPMEMLIQYFEEQQEPLMLNSNAFARSLEMVNTVFEGH